MLQSTPYPETASTRTKWIRALREPTSRPGAQSTPDTLVEHEMGPKGCLLETATIFLINRECPWTCVMCDLWKHTSLKPMSPGHAPVQLSSALRQLEKASKHQLSQIKIYNSGSFFDTKAIYTADYMRIANSLSGYERVIVENHPKLSGKHISLFKELLDPQLEIAMGLEVADDPLLDKLNKRFSLEDYITACEFLNAQRIAHRAFIMVQPPFTGQAEALSLCQRSVRFAFEQEASCVSLIPSRATTGAMHALKNQGNFVQPTIHTLESCFSHALQMNRGRVFVDLWDLEMFSECKVCFEPRRARLQQMNQFQKILPEIQCHTCHP